MSVLVSEEKGHMFGPRCLSLSGYLSVPISAPSLVATNGWAKPQSDQLALLIP